MSQSTSAKDGTHSPLREVGEQIRHLWWVPLVTGLASIGLVGQPQLVTWRRPGESSGSAGERGECLDCVD
jgi:hypothetical protein